MSGFISPKWAVKSSMDSRIILGVVGRHLGWAGVVFCLAFAFGLLNKSRSQNKNGCSHFAMAQPSLFFPHFDFTLMNVYMNTGIK
jgi:hypothetical protein